MAKKYTLKRSIGKVGVAFLGPFAGVNFLPVMGVDMGETAPILMALYAGASGAITTGVAELMGYFKRLAES